MTKFVRLHQLTLIAAAAALLASCSPKNSPAAQTNPAPSGTNTAAASEPPPEPGIQGTECDPDAADTPCKDGLVCRYGGKRYAQCLRTPENRFDFATCTGEGIDDFPTREVDCSKFVVNNITTEENGKNCPIPATNGERACVQIVVGRYLQTGSYVNCPAHYSALNRSDWTIDVNDDFVYCAATGQLNATCETSIALLSGDRYVQDFGSYKDPVTARELCQFKKMGCEFEDWGYDRGTAIKCPKRE